MIETKVATVEIVQSFVKVIKLQCIQHIMARKYGKGWRKIVKKNNL